MCSRMSCLEWVIVFRRDWKNEAFWKESSPTRPQKDAYEWGIRGLGLVWDVRRLGLL